MRFQSSHGIVVLRFAAGVHMEKFYLVAVRKSVSTLVLLFWASLAVAQAGRGSAWNRQLRSRWRIVMRLRRPARRSNRARRRRLRRRCVRTRRLRNADSQFLPVFSPSDFSTDNLLTTQQFDLGVGYTFERGKKRQRRIDAAKDATAVTRYQVEDSERTLTFNVAQQFINAELAQSVLDFATKDLDSFQQTVNISELRYKAGDMSEGDLLKIKLQMLQFQTDVAGAQVSKVQAMASLRQLLGYDAVPDDYEIDGDLVYEPLALNLDDLRIQALKLRPDLLGAQQGIQAAQSQIELAKANAKVDVSSTLSYSHVADQNSFSPSSLCHCRSSIAIKGKSRGLALR